MRWKIFLIRQNKRAKSRFKTLEFGLHEYLKNTFSSAQVQFVGLPAVKNKIEEATTNSTEHYSYTMFICRQNGKVDSKTCKNKFRICHMKSDHENSHEIHLFIFLSWLNQLFRCVFLLFCGKIINANKQSDMQTRNRIKCTKCQCARIPSIPAFAEPLLTQKDILFILQSLDSVQFYLIFDCIEEPLLLFAWFEWHAIDECTFRRAFFVFGMSFMRLKTIP